jgi:hypothetical protein
LYIPENKKVQAITNTTMAYILLFIILIEFVGTVKIQATLELYPGDNDWFDVAGTEVGGDSTVINSSAYSYTFTGKFTWIRAAYNLQNGTITEIRYNY